MLGITFSLLAALLFGFATAMQKYCLRDMKKFSFKKILKNYLWLASISLGLIGIILYVLALRYEAVSIVQPMLSISIIVPVLIGWFFFNEKIKARWIHIVLIIVGVLLISL